MLWPLGDIADPEHLRDFIAGFARGHELAMNNLGVYIDDSVPAKPLSDRYARLKTMLANGPR